MGASLDPHGELFQKLIQAGLSEEEIIEAVARDDFPEQLAGLIRDLSGQGVSEDHQQELAFPLA